MEKTYKLLISNKLYIFDKERNCYVNEYPYGYFKKIYAKYSKTAEISWRVATPKTAPLLENGEVKIKAMPPLAFQAKALASFEKKTFTGSLLSPTGSGKTNFCAYLIQKRACATLVIVPNSLLVTQTIKRFKQILDLPDETFGVINGARKDFGAKIMVATWQSLQDKETLEKMLEHQTYAQVLCDEWHKASADKYNEIVSSINAVYKHGVTATPFRNNEENEKKMIEIAGDIIHKVDIEDLYEEGFLVRPQIEFIKTNYTLDPDSSYAHSLVEKKLSNQKYRWAMANIAWEKSVPEDEFGNKITIKDLATDEKHLGRLFKIALLNEKANASKTNESIDFAVKIGAMKKSVDASRVRTQLVVKNIYKRLSKENEQAMILFNSVDACERMYEKLIEDGYKNVLIITGGDKEKNKKLAQINNSEEYIVVGTVQLLGEGLDIPSISKIFVASPVYPPFSDAARLIQIIGRGIRSSKGKEESFIYIFDDDTSGWISNKKRDAYQTAESYVKPEIKEINNIKKTKECIISAVEKENINIEITCQNDKTIDKKENIGINNIINTDNIGSNRSNLIKITNEQEKSLSLF